MKNEVILLVIMFIFRVMVIKVSKMAHFFIVCVDASKKLVTVRAKHLSKPERSF